MNKEQVYDSQINPLVAEIIRICQEHDIAVLLDFELPVEGDPHLCCSTVLPSGGKNSERHRRMMAIMRSGGMSIAITARDGDGNVTDSTVVL